MKSFSLENKPERIPSYRKSSTVQLLFVSEPFVVESQEGSVTISPDTVDDWDGGYFVAYPDDGSKPYAISPSFVRANYEEIED
jgi:hypothetical protein